MTHENFIINNVRFAKNAQQMDGVLPINGLPRLCDWLTSLGAIHETEEPDFAQLDLGEVTFKLTSDTDASGQQFLVLTLALNAKLLCQRCFKTMTETQSIAFNYLLTRLDEAEIMASEVDVNDDYDLLEESTEMDLRELITDEVIAAIPYAPMHSHDCTALKTEAGEKPNPFAALKDLVKK